MDGNFVAGFVDGEGSFHVAFQRNPTARLGWQVVPEFRVSQNEASAGVLERIRQKLGCGILKTNHQSSPSDQTVVLVVRRRAELVKKVIPFFERHPLYTQKAHDFSTFTEIVRRMETGSHLEASGLARIVHLAYTMNGDGKRRRLSKDEILSDIGAPRQGSADPDPAA